MSVVGGSKLIQCRMLLWAIEGLYVLYIQSNIKKSLQNCYSTPSNPFLSFFCIHETPLYLNPSKICEERIVRNI